MEDCDKYVEAKLNRHPCPPRDRPRQCPDEGQIKTALSLRKLAKRLISALRPPRVCKGSFSQKSYIEERLSSFSDQISTCETGLLEEMPTTHAIQVASYALGLHPDKFLEVPKQLAILQQNTDFKVPSDEFERRVRNVLNISCCNFT